MKELIGTIPKEFGFIAKYRKHQGWWRTFVLNEKEGKYFDKKHKKWKKVCNRIDNGVVDPDKKNFLSKEIADEVQLALNRQKSGIMEADRLYNNLLSSQPLAFNFFGFFRNNPDIALAFLQTIRPDIEIVEDIVFEHAPESSLDSSAFDFGFFVKTSTQQGFIGFECKYTDTFSYQRSDTKIYYGDNDDKNFENYHRLYLENPSRFTDDYYSYIIDKDFNQLFRNELLGVQLKMDFVITGLFCHHDDKKAIAAGLKFQKMIGNGVDDFIVLPYSKYFEIIQKLNLSWEQRELVMILWARYCGLNLSKSIVNEIA